ncbi:MAG TPA: hypothetical protein VHM26_05555 [Chitinophagaceae bacterium]|jgi:hypothetical protein|nr:hypothetical protein [Chitinophagaceae bacterium]
MSTASSIHNLDTLEKEIYRLQLEAAAKEKQLEENVDWLRHNARQMIIDELFCRKRRQTSADESAHNGKHERWKNFFDRMAEQFADRAADGVENLINKLFNKKRKHG